ncbi:outer membrane protein [Helicobacter salomonis]|nr:outer membrane protein [Helicobacter salomonis]
MLLFSRYKHVLATLSTLFISLNAEGNGAFLGGGFVYSHFMRDWNFKMVMENLFEPFAPIPRVGSEILGGDKYSGALFGGDLQVGYKQFFGKEKRFGLRYYAFGSAQGGYYSYLAFGRQTQQRINATQSVAVFFYGAGIDLLSNFYDRKEVSLGIFVGTIIGGESWLLGKSYASNKSCQTQIPSEPHRCVSADAYWKNQASLMESFGQEAKFYNMPSFQIALQGGFRVHLTKHQGFEMGVRFPFMAHNYYTEKDRNDWGNYGKNGSASIVFRRKLALFANYIYNF